MAGGFTYGTVADDAELEAYSAIVKQIFNSTDDDKRREWMRRAGRENVRVVREGTTVVGGLIVIPMGQWFGGRVVPMTGVAAVGTLPEHRGHGAATALMRAAVAEMREDGVPISTLFPMTQPLYRAVGYERAGSEFHVTMSLNEMRETDRTLGLRRATAADEPAIEEVYRRRARASNGHVDRTAYVWDRIRRPQAGEAYGFVVEGPAGIEGYTYYVHNEVRDRELDVWCGDVVALTPGAARRLIALFRDLRSSMNNIGWRCAPGDPILAILREQAEVKVNVNYVWMLRIVDVPSALTLRGYAPGVTAEVHLDLAADDIVPGNSGRWLLRVAAGRAQVERGGRGAVRTDVRGLATLYTGFQSGVELRVSGRVDAPDADLAMASAAFAGPTPWMPDHF